MSHFGSEFDLIEDATGARFVAHGPGSADAVLALVARGDLDGAVHAYEELGEAQRLHLVGEALEARGRPGGPAPDVVAQVLTRARDFLGAARLLDAAGRAEEAAERFAQAGAWGPAAEAFARAGRDVRAAGAFERAGQLERALLHYEAAGAREAVAQCLAKLGRPLQAASVYRELGNVHAELEMLRAVPPADPQRKAAVLRACEVMDGAGQPQRALAYLTGVMREAEGARMDRALRAELVRLLERNGRGEEAARLREALAQGGPSPQPVQRPPAAAASMGPTPPAAPPLPPFHSTTGGLGDGYAFLKAIPLFADLTLDDMKALYRMAQPVVIPAGATVLAKGAQGAGLLVLLSGSVEVFSAAGADGKRLNVLGPGAYLGEISLVDDGPTSAHVRAATQVRALRVSRAAFKQYLETHEGAALRIYRLFTLKLSERVRALSA